MGPARAPLYDEDTRDEDDEPRSEELDRAVPADVDITSSRPLAHSAAASISISRLSDALSEGMGALPRVRIGIVCMSKKPIFLERWLTYHVQALGGGAPRSAQHEDGGGRAADHVHAFGGATPVSASGVIRCNGAPCTTGLTAVVETAVALTSAAPWARLRFLCLRTRLWQ